MSFIDIADPKKRDEIVADYLATVKRVQQRNLEESARDLVQQEHLTNIFKPIVKANAAVIKEEIHPLRTELETLNEHMEQDGKKHHRRRQRFPVIDGNDYLNNGSDAYYSIYHNRDGKFVMGDKEITLKGENIVVDDREYEGTHGLWRLIMENDPKHYSKIDFKNYKELVLQTNVMNHPNIIHTNNRP